MYDEMDIVDLKRRYNADLLIIVATDVELATSLKYLAPISDDDLIKEVYLANTTAYFGKYGLYSAAIVKTNTMGSIQRGGSIQTSSEAIKAFSPKAVIMIGIAFGKDSSKQKIGDVLVAKSICTYEPARINKGDSINFRGAIPESNLVLYNRFTQTKNFEHSYSGMLKNIQIHGGGILSGEKLVDNPEYKKSLFEAYSGAIGGEMEGAGLYAACDEANTPWILMKSICDWGDGTKEKSYQEECCEIVCSYLHLVLNKKLVFKSLSITPFQNIIKDTPEININAKDVIRLLAPRRFLSIIEKSRREERDKSKNIYYEYYQFDNNGRVEGFMFLGKNITLKNTFEHFSDTFSPPQTLSVYLTRKVIDGVLINRKKGIQNKASEYGLTKSASWEVNYVDEIIWDSTLSNTKSSIHTRRNDYIDQNLYTYKGNGNEESNLGISTDFFIQKITNHEEPLASVIFGEGGVGKTTFCDALQYKLDLCSDEIKRKIFFIKGERISQINGVKDAHIDSLLDLYELYRHEQEFLDFGLDDFKLNYICGNITVVIDGLDEIDSAMGERFNLEMFFNSISDLDERFHNSKIIITTRDYFEKNIFDTSLPLKKYRMNGFTDNDLDKYLSIRLNNNPLEREAKAFLKKKELIVNDYFVPMLVDWACEIVVRKDEGKENRPFQQNSKYFLKGFIFDEILIDLLTREMNKQSINNSIDDLFELLVEIAIDYNGSISKHDLDEYVRFTFDEDVQKFLKNPLFVVSSNPNNISLKYEALMHLIKSRYLKVILEEKRPLTDKLIGLLKEAFEGKGSLFDDIIDTLSLDELESLEMVKHYVNQLISKLSDCHGANQKRNIHKCISSLIYIGFKRSTKTTKIERTNLLKDIFSSDFIISHCHIFGDFIPLDFTNVRFMESSFVKYEKFDECTFPENQLPTFTYSSFENVNIRQKCTVKKEHFESTCKFNNCNISDVLNVFEKEHDSLLEQIKSNFISLCRCIDTSGKSINVIKMGTSIKWSSGHVGFIKELKERSFLSLNNKKHYYISNKYSDSIPDVKNGTIPSIIEELIYLIAEKNK